MVVCFREEFHSPCFRKRCKRIEHFRHVPLALLEENACERIGNAELRVLFKELEHERVRREIALLRNLVHYLAVERVVKVARAVCRVLGEERVASKPERLVNLEINANVHNAALLLVYLFVISLVLIADDSLSLFRSSSCVIISVVFALRSFTL